MFTVLLYYKYTHIGDPEDLREQQYALCDSLKIKGRILVSSEGINGTVCGTEENIHQYMEATQTVEGFTDIEWKVSKTEEQVFPKLKVKVRDEVVTLGLGERDVDLAHKAEYIEPEELLSIYENEEDVVVIDARNEYEGRIGKFKNAIVPDIDNFREFPEFVASIEHLKNKPVVTYCTGGIRCEKASAYLKEQGFTNVRQLHGGIHRYADKTGGKNFEGEMYVFDDRVHMPVNSVNPTIISTCRHCETPVARYVNCCNAACNLQFICCESCEKEFGSGCSVECKGKSRFDSIPLPSAV